MNKSTNAMNPQAQSHVAIDAKAWLRERVVRVNKIALILVVVIMTLLLLCGIYFFDQRSQQHATVAAAYTDDDVSPATSHWYDDKTNAVPGYESTHAEIDTRGNSPLETSHEQDTASEKDAEYELAEHSYERLPPQTQDLLASEQQSPAADAALVARNSALSMGSPRDAMPGLPTPGASPSAMSTLDNAVTQQLNDALSAPFNAAGSDSDHQSEKKRFLERAQTQVDSTATPLLPAAPQHVLSAGTLIPAVLISGIDSDLPGSALAQVRQPVYDAATGGHVLIPQGAKLLLHYDSDVAFGQKRVLVTVTRVLFPDGTSHALPAQSVGDVGGFTGFQDQVNNHYGRTFGSAALLGIISGGMQLSQPQNQSAIAGPSATQTAAAAMGQQLSEVATQTISKHLNVQPSLRIRPGYLFNITVLSDVVFNDNNE
jgi:type IV secretory pathway VirB10-like protein